MGGGGVQNRFWGGDLWYVFPSPEFSPPPLFFSDPPILAFGDLCGGNSFENDFEVLDLVSGNLRARKKGRARAFFVGFFLLPPKAVRVGESE